MPRDPGRITRITRKLEILWLISPDARLGQMLAYVQGAEYRDPFYIEDDEWESRLDDLLKITKKEGGRG